MLKALFNFFRPKPAEKQDQFLPQPKIDAQIVEQPIEQPKCLDATAVVDNVTVNKTKAPKKSNKKKKSV